MTRTMGDALDPNNMPADVDIVTYYVDVLSPAEARQRWPGRQLLSIARNHTEDADVADVEATDFDPIQVAPWVQRQRSNGNPWPWAYCNQSNWPSVRTLVAAARIAPPWYWLAIPGATSIPAGAVAVQNRYLGGYDLSMVLDHIAGLDSPHQAEKYAMFLVFDADGSEWLVHGGTITQIVDPNFSNQLLQSGVPRVNATNDQVTKLRESNAAAGGGPSLAGQLQVSGTVTVS